MPYSRIPEEEEVPPTPTSPSVIEFLHSQKNHVAEPFTVTLTNTLYTGTVPPGNPNFLHRPPDTPLVAAVGNVSPTPQEAQLTQEERSEILRNLDQQQSGRKIGWLPEIPASRPSEKIDHTKCGLPVVEEPPPEVVTLLLEEFHDVFAQLPKGLPKS